MTVYVYFVFLKLVHMKGEMEFTEGLQREGEEEKLITFRQI